MILLYFLPEIVLIISFFTYGFILGSKNFRIKTDKIILNYIFLISFITCILWLIFLFFLPDIIILTYKAASNKLFIIFKLYIIGACISYYFNNKCNILKTFLIQSLALASFILITFNSNLIYFIAFSFMLFSIIGFIIQSEVNLSRIVIILPIVFILTIFITFNLESYTFLFTILSTIALSYFINDKSLHYLISAIIVPNLLFYLIKFYSSFNTMFFDNLLTIGIMLTLLSTILSLSNNFKHKIVSNLFLNYYGMILILIGLRVNSSILIALSFILLIPFLFSDNFFSVLSLSLIPISPFFIFKLILLVILFKYSFYTFILFSLSSTILTYNSIISLKNIKLSLNTKLLYLLSYTIMFFVSYYYNEINTIINRVII